MATPKWQGPVLGTETAALAAGNYSSWLPAKGPHLPLAEKTAQQISLDLTSAIQVGNVQKAQELAAMLAKHQAWVTITLNTAWQQKKACEQEISITVHVEDRESAGLTLNDVKVRPSDTILDLKRMFLGKYSFPLEVQKWIIGNRIVSDEETLSKCQVTTSGHTLYLYLLNAHSVNISHEDYRRQLHNSTGTTHATGTSMRSGVGQESDYTALNFAIIPQATSTHDLNVMETLNQEPSAVFARRQQSQLSATSSSTSLTAEANCSPWTGHQGAADLTGQDEGGTLVAAMEETGQLLLTCSGEAGAAADHTLQLMPEIRQSADNLPQGWHCESCTLINQPTRPGCEACGSPRPTSYQLPAGYVISDEERQRLRREQEVEEIMQKTSGQGWSQRLGQGGATISSPFHPPSEAGTLTAEQLDHILRFNDAIQSHLATSSVGERRATAEDVWLSGNSCLVPQRSRQPEQNAELGEDVPDSNNGSTLLGWGSDDDDKGVA